MEATVAAIGADFAAQFFSVFSARGDSLIRNAEAGSWRRMSQFHLLTDEEILAALSDVSNVIRAVSFDKVTRYAAIGVPEHSPYLELNEFRRLTDLLASLGLKPRIYKSAGANEIHLFMFLADVIKSAVAQESLSKVLSWNGFSLREDRLLIYPGAGQISLPLQRGFAWLNEDLQPIVSRVEIALDSAVALFCSEISRYSTDFDRVVAAAELLPNADMTDAEFWGVNLRSSDDSVESSDVEFESDSQNEQPDTVSADTVSNNVQLLFPGSRTGSWQAESVPTVVEEADDAEQDFSPQVQSEFEQSTLADVVEFKRADAMELSEPDAETYDVVPGEEVRVEAPHHVDSPHAYDMPSNNWQTEVVSLSNWQSKYGTLDDESSDDVQPVEDSGVVESSRWESKYSNVNLPFATPQRRPIEVSLNDQEIDQMMAEDLIETQIQDHSLFFEQELEQKAVNQEIATSESYFIEPNIIDSSLEQEELVEIAAQVVSSIEAEIEMFDAQDEAESEVEIQPAAEVSMEVAPQVDVESELEIEFESGVADKLEIEDESEIAAKSKIEDESEIEKSGIGDESEIANDSEIEDESIIESEIADDSEIEYKSITESESESESNSEVEVETETEVESESELEIGNESETILATDLEDAHAQAPYLSNVNSVVEDSADRDPQIVSSIQASIQIETAPNVVHVELETTTSPALFDDIKPVYQYSRDDINPDHVDESFDEELIAEPEIEREVYHDNVFAIHDEPYTDSDELPEELMESADEVDFKVASPKRSDAVSDSLKAFPMWLVEEEKNVEIFPVPQEQEVIDEMLVEEFEEEVEEMVANQGQQPDELWPRQSSQLLSLSSDQPIDGQLDVFSRRNQVRDFNQERRKRRPNSDDSQNPED